MKTQVNIKRVLLVVLLVVAVVAIFLVVTTPRGYSKVPDRNDRNTISHWSTASTFSADLNAVRHWKTHRIRHQAIVPNPEGGSMNCQRSIVTVTGSNFLFHDLIWGTTTANYCYIWQTNTLVKSTVHFYHGAGAAGWTLWGRDAANDSEIGPSFGWSDTHHTAYVYDRYYFAFSRGLTGPLSQHLYPWVAMTVRGDGSCTADKYSVGGTISC